MLPPKLSEWQNYISLPLDFSKKTLIVGVALICSKLARSEYHKTPALRQISFGVCFLLKTDLFPKLGGRLKAGALEILNVQKNMKKLKGNINALIPFIDFSFTDFRSYMRYMYCTV